MYRNVYTLLLIIAATGGSSALNIISRDGWGARDPTSTQGMANPVPYVVIHHSESPGACYSKADCIDAMQSMQNYHMDSNGWADIGYSFGVGSDGNAYTGRGWSRVGAHAPGYNSQSIGICLIGNWMNDVPPSQQLQAVHELIQYGVDNGKISSSYKLVGHREVTATDCPGDSLYREIQSWAHYTPNP
ncbi:Amidase 2 domain containing protein [Asbolus verrucosus]|uniref:Peptidoglycan-recognition protein n=1 Tax=Asbolus verrucosus TaxID=1661398 RepID=A0A482VE89_ASBVE|nr:Amidase 2 domain containing protein [Asbolus verrucosus]